jgi:hypothetical protein
MGCGFWVKYYKWCDRKKNGRPPYPELLVTKKRGFCLI